MVPHRSRAHRTLPVLGLALVVVAATLPSCGRGTDTPVASDPGVTTPVVPAPAFASARSLVDALHRGDGAARLQLRAWMHEPIRKLMGELCQRHNLSHNLDRLVRHALHAAETYLHTRPFQQFAPLSLLALRSTLLLYVAKQAVQPFGGLRSRIRVRRSTTSFGTCLAAQRRRFGPRAKISRDRRPRTAISRSSATTASRSSQARDRESFSMRAPADRRSDA